MSSNKLAALLFVAVVCSVLALVSARKPTFITGEKLEKYRNRLECDPEKEVFKVAECDYPDGRYGKYGKACPYCSTLCGRLFFKDIKKESAFVSSVTACCCQKKPSVQAWWLSVDRTD